MGWYDSYKPQTSGVDVAKGMRESGNAFTALGKAFGDIGENIIQKKKRELEEEQHKLAKAYSTARTDALTSHMGIAEKNQKQKEIDNKAVLDVSKAYNGDNPLADFNKATGMIPSAETSKWANAFGTQHYDDKAIRQSLVFDNIGDFREANPKLFKNASGKVLQGISAGYKEDSYKQRADKREDTALNNTLANSALNRKIATANHEAKQQQALIDKEIKAKNLEFYRGYLMADDKGEFVNNIAKEGGYIPDEILTPKSKTTDYSRKRDKNKDILGGAERLYNDRISNARSSELQALRVEKYAVTKKALELREEYPELDGTEILLLAQEMYGEDLKKAGQKENEAIGQKEDKKRQETENKGDSKGLLRKAGEAVISTAKEVFGGGEAPKHKVNIGYDPRPGKSTAEVKIPNPKTKPNMVTDPKTGKDIHDVLNIVPKG